MTPIGRRVSGEAFTFDEQGLSSWLAQSNWLWRQGIASVELGMRPNFIKALEEGPLVFDGAMGTQLYERGIYVNKSFDSANLSRPDLVREVHREYMEAGAQVLTTNTFSSNAIKLKRHGLEQEAETIARAGVRLAKEVAGDKAWVAASIGPTGQTPTMLTEEELQGIRQAFLEQARAMEEEGADVIVLETFRQLAEIRLALEAVQEATALPVVAQMSFDGQRQTADGAGPRRVAMLLSQWGADVVGANCMEGPHVLYDVVQEMLEVGPPVIAQPNAGYPQKIEERLVYMATPDYFGVYARRYYKAGVRVVGGCCGTGPEHVAEVAAAARTVGGGRVQITTHRGSVEERERQGDGDRPEPARCPTGLAEKVEAVYERRIVGDEDNISADSFVVSVEVNPPAGLRPDKAVEAAAMLQRGGVDVVNIADGPRASVRMANWAMGHIIGDRLGMEVILHLCGRDRNLLGIQSDILGLEAMGLNNLVVITGDPPKVGDYPHATAVFDLDSIGILKLIDQFNRGIDPAGKDMGQATSFYCATGAEPAAADYDRELKRLEEKKKAGARFVMTQPVYDPQVLDRFLDDIEGLELPVLVGLLPLASYRNAEFLHHEVPGMAVPGDIRKRMKAVGSGPEARSEGVKIAQETLERIKHRVVGAYIMPPFRRYEAALELLSCIDGFQPPRGEDSERGEE